MLNFPINSPWFWPLVIWSVVWKGFALWRAGRLSQKYWFIALFVLNTAGILDILYLFVFSKKADKGTVTDQISQ